MLKTQLINGWLGTSYSLEEIAEMDDLVFEIMTALREGITPRPPKPPEA